MRKINNRDLPFLEELKGILTAETFQYSDGTEGEFAEVQIGIQKRPAWFPFLSLHTSETDFAVQSSGKGAGMRARRKQSDIVIEIMHQCADPEEGQARLLDLKWLLVELLAEHTDGQTYRFMDIGRADHMLITNENPTEDLPWGFQGQIVLTGTVEFAS